MGSVRATTFELLPQRVDLLGFVLSSAGIGALLGSLYGHWQGASRDQRAIQTERFALASAGVGLALFLLVGLIQALL